MNDLTDSIQKLAAFAKRKHRQCEDNYYSCPKAEGGCSNEMGDECDCGADEHNAVVEQTLGEAQEACALLEAKALALRGES